MRHMRAHRKLGRTTAHRRALLRNMVQSLFVSRSGRIETTVEKAKEARRMADKMITLGKRETVHARRLARRFIPDRAIVKRLFDDIAPRYADRAGGYTRVLRIGARQGDNAEMALLELVGIAEEAQREATAGDKKAARGEAKADDKKAAAKEKKSTRRASRPDAGKKAKASTKSSAAGAKRTSARAKKGE